MLNLSIRTNVREISKSLTAFAYKQLPYAQAQAVNGLAKKVQQVEVESLKQTFPTATPFTLKSVGMRSARKDNPVAVVFIKDVAAHYLQPFETGGDHTLPGDGKTWFNPKDKQLLNTYGNLPKGLLARLKNRPDIFIGAVKTKSGQIVNGVWQRPHRSAKQKVVGRSRLSRLSNTSGHLKLLIRFGDPIPVKQHLGWGAKAQATVNQHFKREFGAALAKAIRTAR